MPLNIEQTSTEFVRIPVSAITEGQNYDPTADSVAFAFLPPGTEPTNLTTWTTGSWDTTGPPYDAKCLVGPHGGLALAVGTYDVWVKITDNPEIPVKFAGTVTIY